MVNDLIARVQTATSSGDTEFVLSDEYPQIEALRRTAAASGVSASWIALMNGCANSLLLYPAEPLPAAWWAEASANVNGFAGLADGIDLITAVWFHPAADRAWNDERLTWLHEKLRRLTLQVPLASEPGLTYTSVLNSRWDGGRAAAIDKAMIDSHLSRSGLLRDLDVLRAAVDRFTARLDKEVRSPFYGVGDLVQEITNFLRKEPVFAAEEVAKPAAAPLSEVGVVSVFIQVQGLVGGSVTVGHRNWIDARSYRHTIAPSTPAIRIEKLLDCASAQLYEACSTARELSRVTFEICRGPDRLLLRVDLEDAVISSITQSTSDGEGSLPVEEVTFRYGRIQWTYTQYGMDLVPEGVIASSRVVTKDG